MSERSRLDCSGRDTRCLLAHPGTWYPSSHPLPSPALLLALTPRLLSLHSPPPTAHTHRCCGSLVVSASWFHSGWKATGTEQMFSGSSLFFKTVGVRPVSLSVLMHILGPEWRPLLQWWNRCWHKRNQLNSVYCVCCVDFSDNRQRYQCERIFLNHCLRWPSQCISLLFHKLCVIF